MRTLIPILALWLATLSALGQATPGSYPYPKPLPASGSTPGGHIKPTATLSTSDYSDVRAVAWDVMLGGVDIKVGTTAERDAFPAARRKQGMIAYVCDVAQEYRLASDLTTWVLIPSGGGGGGASANMIVVDNVDAVRSLNPSSWTNVATRGYYSPGDGGANVYYWVADTSGQNSGSKLSSLVSGSWTNISSGRINVRQWGAKGDGINNDTAAIQGAVNAAASTYVVWFPPGTYLVNQRIDIPLASTTWVGERTTRGSSLGYPTTGGAQIPNVRIRFRPATSAEFLVDEWAVPDPQDPLGPYVFHDIYFDLDTANGLRFGNEGLGIGTILTNQKYISGVQVKGCSFAHAVQVFDGFGNTVAMNSAKSIQITKGFECDISESSFSGGESQIRLYGCDNPIISKCRMNYAWNAITYIGLEHFQVQGNIGDCQFEQWGGSPVVIDGAEMAMTRCRFEQFPNAAHVVTLPQTATLVAGSSTITMSSSVAGILVPGTSILRLTGTGGTLHVLVTSVSGVSVGFDSACTSIPFTEAGVSVTRIHGYGPIVKGIGNVSCANASVTVQPGAPSFVHVPSGGGTFSITGAHSIIGASDTASLCIANRHGEQYFLNGIMSFAGTTPNIIGDPRNPMIVVSDIQSGKGVFGQNSNARAPYGTLEESLAIIGRRWSYTPKSAASYAYYANRINWAKIPVHPNTKETIWAWQYKTGGPDLWIEDPTIPFSTDTSIKVRMKWRAVTGSATVSVAANGYLSTPLISDTATTTFKTSVYSGGIPLAWAGGRTQATPLVGFQINATADVYIGAIDIIEADP